MSGNVYEWVQDLYDKNYYKSSPKDNPKRPSSGSYRALSGGAWGGGPPAGLAGISPAHGRAAKRNGYTGFRLSVSAQ